MGIIPFILPSCRGPTPFCFNAGVVKLLGIIFYGYDTWFNINKRFYFAA